MTKRLITAKFPGQSRVIDLIIIIFDFFKLFVQTPIGVYDDGDCAN